jgi:hypothetical protein
MGFEPMPLSRLAPKASALTTRPNLLSCLLPSHTHAVGTDKKKNTKNVTVPGGTRTPNPQIRSLMRYPLRHWDQLEGNCGGSGQKEIRQQWDLNPRGQSPST